MYINQYSTRKRKEKKRKIKADAIESEGGATMYAKLRKARQSRERERSWQRRSEQRTTDVDGLCWKLQQHPCLI